MVFTKFVVPSFLGETFLQYFFAAVKQETDDVVEEKTPSVRHSHQTTSQTTLGNISNDIHVYPYLTSEPPGGGVQIVHEG